MCYLKSMITQDWWDLLHISKFGIIFEKLNTLICHINKWHEQSV